MNLNAELASLLGDFLAGVEGLHRRWKGAAAPRASPARPRSRAGRRRRAGRCRASARGVGEDAGRQRAAVGADATETAEVDEDGLSTHTGGSTGGRDPGGATTREPICAYLDASDRFLKSFQGDI